MRAQVPETDDELCAAPFCDGITCNRYVAHEPPHRADVAADYIDTKVPRIKTRTGWLEWSA